MGEEKIPELREHLKKRLPEDIVPGAYVVMERLPLTPNGKLDKKALPEPEGMRPELGLGYVTPRTAVEEMLCEVWARVLGLDEVGVEDDFFEFGGHSLLATQVMSQVRRLFGIEMELRCLFESPTIARLARRVEEAHTQQEKGAGALLDEIENMRPDEVEALLSKYEEE